MVESQPGAVSEAPRRAAVIGHPVGHSLSPVMHCAAYAALGLQGWRYDAIEVDEPDLGPFLDSLGPQWAGLSVTMPLKRALGGHLVSQSELATQVGAVNTVTIDASGRHGFNTDVYGIVQALGDVGVQAAWRAVVLGAGATAASALAALRDLGCTTPVVLARSPGRAGPLADAAARLGVRPTIIELTEANLAAQVRAIRGPGSVVITTLPSGAVDPITEVLVEAAGLGAVGSGHEYGPVLLDVVYDPWPTPLAAAWRAAGGDAVGGFSMLLHQAEGQIRLMTGLRPPLAVMRAAGLAELERRSRAGNSSSR